MKTMPRRMFLLSTLVMPGCAAITSLNQAAAPRDVFELRPTQIAQQSTGSKRTLLIVEPTAPAAIATNRILIKDNPLSVTYLPDGRWADDVPLMLQSILVQSLSESGIAGFVGPQGNGPVPDIVLLTRIDAFTAEIAEDDTVQVQISLSLTLLRDRDQEVLGTRRFAETLAVLSDQTEPIVRGFQQALDIMLPNIVTWVARN